MKKTAVLAAIREVGLVPVLRAPSLAEALALADALAEGGATILEITMTVPGALEAIRTLRTKRPDLLVGAGTVLDAETARLCMLEGAQFIVSPALNLGTIEMCHRYATAVLPGALTPTEVLTAWQAGADIVKVFPVSAMGGASYLRSLLAPLPQVLVIPTGGISLANAHEFMHAGALALGVGADLVNGSLLKAEGPRAVTALAAQYVGVVQRFRQTL